MPARSTVRRLDGDRGAAAVEFALVAPLLVLLLLGIISFSLVMSARSTVAEAAREGVRAMTLQNSSTAAITAAQAALTSGMSGATVTVSPSTCTGASTTTQVTVTVTYHQAYVGGFLGGVGQDVVGTAVMRCGG